MYGRRFMWFSLACLLGMLFGVSDGLALPAQGGSGVAPRLLISGQVVDPHREPVKDAEVRLWVDKKLLSIRVHGKEVQETETGSEGAYLIEAELAGPLKPATKVTLEIRKAGSVTERVGMTGRDFAHRGREFLAFKDITLPRVFGPAFWLSTIVFLGAYVLIAFELLHRTIAAMLGTAIMLAVSYTIGTLNPDFHVISFEAAMHKIDMNVIFLLMGMMIIVGLLKNTGVFQWSAYKCFQIARGKVLALSVVLMTFTAIASAFLDNVTTMLLLTPVTIEIALALRISPLAMLIPEVLASNIGGTATLIGDPPNIMIGSYTGLTFMAFVENLALVCAISMVALFVSNKI
jgi:hypothetical protein